MTEQKFLLSSTPTAKHLVNVKGDQGKNVTLSLELAFDFTFYDTTTIIWFLRAVKVNPEYRHTYSPAGDTYSFEYDPTNPGLEKFVITHVANGRSISMGLATAWRLLDALSGKTDAELRQELTTLAGDRYRINVEDGLLDVIPVDPTLIVSGGGGATTVRNDCDGLQAAIRWLQDRP